jgi:hypothetical protein
VEKVVDNMWKTLPCGKPPPISTSFPHPPVENLLSLAGNLYLISPPVENLWETPFD